MSRIGLALAVAAGLAAAPAAAGTAFDVVFPAGLPWPFAAALDRLRAEVGAENVATTLIPLGRSLQRYGAAPDFFASPRVVVAVTGDRAAGPGGARLADRLFLGYQPAAAVVEVIAYDAAAGRFEFREVVGYDATNGAAAPAERRVCLACHQGEGPIFARPLWSETNANPAIAARLAGLGDMFHGAQVRQSVDALEALDAATDRAARVALADRLWSEGCPDAACRAALLAAALRVGLGAGAGAPPAGFGARWPEGLAAIDPDLPNRDPLPADVDPLATLETEGALDPETPRPPVTLWRPGPDGFADAARAVAAQLSPGDLAWIDGRLAPRAGAGEARSLACETRMVDVAVGRETRFTCADGDAHARGFIAPGGAGRIDSLWLGGAPPVGRVAVESSVEAGATLLRPKDLAPRLADGRRVAEFVLADGRVEVRLADDLGPLAAALAARAAAGDAAFAPAPFDRPAVLGLIAELTEPADG